MAEIFVVKAADMADGDRRILRTGKGEIGIFRHKGNFHAYANQCVHSGGPACEGLLIPKVLEIIGEDRTYQGQTFSEDEMHFVCPWHGYEYNIETGVFVGDTRLKLKKYQVVERGGDIYVVA